LLSLKSHGIIYIYIYAIVLEDNSSSYFTFYHITFLFLIIQLNQNGY
jgi:hypothetical protein